MAAAASASSKEATENNMLQDMTNEQLNKTVRGLDRPLLLKILDLDFKLSVVADVHKLKPISLHAKKQMKVHSALLPFVNTGAFLPLVPDCMFLCVRSPPCERPCR